MKAPSKETEHDLSIFQIKTGRRGLTMLEHPIRSLTHFIGFGAVMRWFVAINIVVTTGCVEAPDIPDASPWEKSNNRWETTLQPIEQGCLTYSMVLVAADAALVPRGRIYNTCAKTFRSIWPAGDGDVIAPIALQTEESRFTQCRNGAEPATILPVEVEIPSREFVETGANGSLRYAFQRRAVELDGTFVSVLWPREQTDEESSLMAYDGNCADGVLANHDDDLFVQQVEIEFPDEVTSWLETAVP